MGRPASARYDWSVSYRLRLATMKVGKRRQTRGCARKVCGHTRCALHSRFACYREVTTVISSDCQRLSPIDASFLQLESPCAHMHVGWSAILSPAENGPRPTIEAMRERIAGRLALMPRCRQRLLLAPLGLTEPRWVDDPRFDLRLHVVELSDPDKEISLERF